MHTHYRIMRNIYAIHTYIYIETCTYTENRCCVEVPGSCVDMTSYRWTSWDFAPALSLCLCHAELPNKCPSHKSATDRSRRCDKKLLGKPWMNYLWLMG